jgi:hypothetical protein
LEIIAADAGIQIDRRDEQSENADSPRHESLEPDSNLKSESFEHMKKQNWNIVSVEEGTQIDRSDEQWENVNAFRCEI